MAKRYQSLALAKRHWPAMPQGGLGRSGIVPLASACPWSTSLGNEPVSGAPHGFAACDYEHRTEALQDGMARAGLGALLLTTEADVAYVTGFATRFWESPTRPWFVVLPVVGRPLAVIPAIGAACMARTRVREIRTWQSPNLVDDGVGLLAQTLLEVVPKGGLIGLPMGPETHLRMPLVDFERLRAAVAPLSFADATTVVRRVREVKSAAEIEAIRAACRVVERAFAALPAIAGVGVPLDAVFRGFQIACLEAGADRVAYLAGAAGRGGYLDVISPATPKPLARDDVLMLDAGVVRNGYFCDLDRNVAIGRADDAVRRAHALLYAAIEAGLAVVRPGITSARLHHVMAAALEAGGGVPASGRFGHGLGLQLTEWPSLMPGDDTVLREGMVLTLEPAVVLGPERLMVAEENIVVRADGAELLSIRAPAELPVIG